MKRTGNNSPEVTKCPKCGGAMAFENFRGASSEAVPWSYDGWRCVYCGMVIDPLIMSNRMNGSPPDAGRQRGVPKRHRRN